MLTDYHNPKKLVVQHKKLINARYSMSLNELRIFVYMMLQITKEDKEFRDVRIPCQILHSNKKSIHYLDIKEATLELTGKTLQIEQLLNNGKRSWNSIPLMSYCAYTEGEGYITACFNNKAAPYLLDLSENFKAVEYQRWNNLNSVNSYRFFWFLIQFEDTGYFEVRVSELKAMLQMEDKHKLYSNFKKRVLLPVQEDLEKNGLPFTFREDKCGTRRVEKLKFFFSKKLPMPKSASANQKSSSRGKTNQQQAINFKVESTGDQRTDLDETARWMLGLGFSLGEVSAYKQKIKARDLWRSVYGLQTNYGGNSRPIQEVYEICKECLDGLVKKEHATA